MPSWGLVIGDCIHNARTALDYVAVRLWALTTGTTPDEVDVSFPIRSVGTKPDDTDADIQKAFADARAGFKSSTAKFREQPGFSGYLTTIEQLQPFNFDNPSIWGAGRFAVLPTALDRLSRLDNLDKHRVPHATWTSLRLFKGAPAIQEFAPDDFECHGSSTTYGPLENDAQVATCSFKTPLPREWKPDEMDMQRCFPLQVSFGDHPLFQGVMEVLGMCLWGVGAVLTIFNPVFGGEPPLPVTTIAEPR
jgi:hypothetical protein